MPPTSGSNRDAAWVLAAAIIVGALIGVLIAAMGGSFDG